MLCESILSRCCLVLGLVAIVAGQQCDDPGMPANSDRYLSALDVGEVATFTCKTGYQMNSDGASTLSMECLSSRLWNASLPTCQKVSCGDPGDMPNTTHTGSHMYLDVVTYRCLGGYRMPDWSKKQLVTCQATKQWDPIPNGCVRIQCIEPEVIPFANRTSAAVGPYWLSALLTYECWFGFRPKESAHLTLACGDKGFWEGTWPECLKIRCGDPGMVTNAGRIVTGNGAGTVLIYSCNRGYMQDPNEGPLNRTCQENAKWTGSGQPACIGVPCGVPRTVSNATFIPTNPTHRFPETLRYTCDAGFRANYTLGIDEITCTWQGVWDFQPFTCDRVRCIETKMSENTEINNNYFYYTDVKVMSCLVGHQLTNGSLSRTCEANGYFSDDPPICRKVRCPNPHLMPQYTANVTITGEGNEYRQIVTFTCHTGFEIAGGQSLTFRQSGICQADATWKPPLPVCRRVTCGEPDLRLNVGIASYDGPYFGDVVSYNCSYGYEPYKGNVSRTCQSNRRWSGDTFQCIEKSCGTLSTFQNGQVIGTNFRYKGQISFRCNTGYVLAGEQTIKCLADGSWTTQQPFCERISCGMPENLPHMNYTSSKVNANNYVFGEKITYSCLTGYYWRSSSGPLERTCTENTRWSGNRPICDPHSCGDPGTVPGTYKLGVKFTYGEIVNYTCSTGFEAGSGRPWSVLTCAANKQWVGTKPICTEIKCGDPGLGINTTRQVNSFSYSGWIRYYCKDGFYYPDGRFMLRCLETKNWSAPVPHCQVVPQFAPVPQPLKQIEQPAEADDAQTYGYVGIALMGFEALCVIILDLTTIEKEIRLLRRNLNIKAKKAKKHIKKKIEKLKENFEDAKKKEPATFKGAGMAVIAGSALKGQPPPYQSDVENSEKDDQSPPPPYLSLGAMAKLKGKANQARERRTKYTFKRPTNAPPPYSSSTPNPSMKKPESRNSGASADGSEPWARPVKPKNGPGGRKIYMA